MPNGTAPADATRLAAELILSDESLVPDLDSNQAARLMRWAVDLAGRMVAARSQRCLPMDRAAIAEAVRPVRLLIRAIDRLVANRAQMDQGEFLERLLAVLDAARQIEAGSRS